MKNLRKILSLLLVLLLAVTLFSACGEKPAEPSETSAPVKDDVTIRVGGLKGPTTMGLVKLMEDAEAGQTENAYEFTMAAMADELTPKLLKGELDAAVVPANLIAVLNRKSEGAVKMAAVTVLGVVYIVEKGGEEIASLADLAGRTVYATGKGSVPEYALTYLLAQNGLTLGEDVTVEWKSEPTEVVAQMSTDEYAVAMLPQPFVTVAKGTLDGLRVVLDLTEEWEKLDNGSLLITAGLAVTSSFAEEHPDALRTFLEEYQASTEYVNANPAEASLLIEKAGIVKAAVAEKAIPACNLVFLTGSEMTDAVPGYLGILYDLNPAAVGGSLPGDDFFVTLP